MKRIIVQFLILILCLLIVFTATACRDTGDTTTTTTPSSQQSTESTPAQTPTEGVNATNAPATESDKSDTPAQNTGDDRPAQNTNTNTIGPALVPESSNVNSNYFDNVAFVGDSVSLKLSYYAASTGALGNAQFFTAGSLGCANALWEVSDESVHPSYQGTKMLIEDCVAYSGADTLYIMLGMNDIGLYGIDDTIDNYKTLLGKIVEKSPSIKIVVQSMTPMTDTSEILGESLNNENIKIYNSRLCDMCSENGWSFVDVASVMYDAQGVSLNRDYCSDPDGLGVHFTEAGCEAWIEYLSTHTP